MYRNIVKNIIDKIISIISLIILSPIILIITILIKISSDGPVFFLQDRLGYKGNTFKIIKFRTMVVGAEHIGEGLKVSSDNDSRITKIGHLLRATSLDELPQLINILNGTMSIVGPRPPVTYYPYNGYENYPEWAKRRFDVKPGITGLAQVKVRNSVVWDERIKIDIQYVNNISFINDLKIIFLTFYRVIRRKDIYMG